MDRFNSDHRSGESPSPLQVTTILFEPDTRSILAVRDEWMRMAAARNLRRMYDSLDQFYGTQATSDKYYLFLTILLQNCIGDTGVVEVDGLEALLPGFQREPRFDEALFDLFVFSKPHANSGFELHLCAEGDAEHPCLNFLLIRRGQGLYSLNLNSISS